MTSTDNTNKAIQLANKRLSIRDANGDGKVNLEELKEFYANDEQLNCYFSKKELNEMAGEYFTELDRNGDGYIKMSEMSENSEAIKCLELANTRLSIRDRNGDGVVTLVELEQFYVNDEQLSLYFSETELINTAREYFEKLDINKDGVIRQVEMI